MENLQTEKEIMQDYLHGRILDCLELATKVSEQFLESTKAELHELVDKYCELQGVGKKVEAVQPELKVGDVLVFKKTDYSGMFKNGNEYTVCKIDGAFAYVRDEYASLRLIHLLSESGYYWKKFFDLKPKATENKLKEGDILVAKDNVKDYPFAWVCPFFTPKKEYPIVSSNPLFPYVLDDKGCYRLVDFTHWKKYFDLKPKVSEPELKEGVLSFLKDEYGAQ